MVVTRCKECPFFHETMATVLSVFMGRRDPPQGVCCYHAQSDSLCVADVGLPPGPAHDEMIRRWWARLVISDAQSIPPDCPLRRQDIVITLTPALTPVN